MPHKGGRTYGYRVSDGHSVLTYIPDHCPTDLGPGPDVLGEYHAAALDLAAGADLLIHDAFLLAGEAAAEASFGHAAAQYAAGLGVLAGARRVALAHHKPDRTDDGRWTALAAAAQAPGSPGDPPGRLRGRRGRDTRAMSPADPPPTPSWSAPAPTAWPRRSPWPGPGSGPAHRGRGHAGRRLPDERAHPAGVPSRRLLGGAPARRVLPVLHQHRPGRPRGHAVHPQGRVRPPA